MCRCRKSNVAAAAEYERSKAVARRRLLSASDVRAKARERRQQLTDELELRGCSTSLRRDKLGVEAADRMLQLLRLLHYNRELSTVGTTKEQQEVAAEAFRAQRADAKAAAAARAARLEALDVALARIEADGF